MNQLVKWLVKVFFFIMSGAFVVYEAMRSLNFIQATLSADDQVLGYLALFGTCIGGLVWLGVFLHESKGVPQKGIAVGMTLLDTFGGIGLFMFETFRVSGENGLTKALEAGEIRQTILAMSALIGANILALVFFHIAEPDNLARLDQHFTDWKIEQAILKAKREKADAIAGDIAQREADAYAIEQRAKDRSDKALDERTAGAVFAGMADKLPAWMKPAKRDELPTVAAETVGLPTLTDRPQPTPAAELWQGRRKDNPVYFYDDGMPRYHPAFSLDGKRWATDENGVRVMVDGSTGGLYNAFRHGVAEAQGVEVEDLKSPLDAIKALSPNDKPAEAAQTGATFQGNTDIPESQNGGLDGGYTHNLSA